MKNAIFIVALLLLFFQINVEAQTTNDFISLKNFSQPSPEAAAIARYGNIPVGLSSGIPEISVPIGEIKSRKLSLPMSFSYHASGIRIEDVATTVGLGWVLNAGGIISRTIVGMPDEQWLNDNDPMVLKTRAQLENVTYNAEDFNTLQSLANGNRDPQSDVYNMNIPGISGKFVYDVNKELHYTPVDKQLKIIRNVADSTFTITDDEGVKYFFGEKEYTDTRYHAITAWYLTRIVSADLTDTIAFTYKPASAFEEKTYSYTLYIDLPIKEPTEACCQKDDPIISWQTQMLQSFYYRKLISEITFSNGSVKFDYVSDRLDPVPERLTKISISNNQKLLKEIELVHSYFQSSTPVNVPAKYTRRLKLDKVKYNDNSKTEVNSYSFSYNSTPLPAYYNSSMERSTSMDYWGYYIGDQGNRTLLPKSYKNEIIQFMGTIYTGGPQVAATYEEKAIDRSVNPTYTKAGILNKITYPTGGYTVFEYENNTLTALQDSKDMIGGLRIARMHNFDPLRGTVSTKTYVYDADGVVPISWLRKDDFKYTTSTLQYAQCFGGLYCTTYSLYINANPINGLNYFGGSPVFYKKVTEYEGFPGNNNGKTEYAFSFEADSSYEQGVLLKYWNFSTDKSWARGQLENKKIFRSEGGNYSLIKEFKNYYISLKRKAIRVGQICDQINFTKGFQLDAYLTSPNSIGSDKIMLRYFDYADIILSIGGKMIAKTEEIDYLNNAIINRKEYTYGNSAHIYPTTITTTSSKTNEEVSQVIKYPQDKASIQQLTTSASAALDGMVASNILSTPVETDYLRNNNLFRRERTDYINWNNTNKFYADLLYQKNGSGPLESRIKYRAYDEKGNPVSLQYINGHPVSYVWDYNKTLVTAVVTNANENEIAYTSFETANNGNWIINSNLRITNTSYSGTNAYNPINGSVTRSGLTADKDYIVSYWSRGNSATVNGAGGESKSSKNGWTLFEHVLQHPANITVTGNVVIDELRLHPKDAQMTSYTHVPLVGVSSVSTENNSTTFYDYDNYSRLNLVMDDDRNILKQYDYKYSSPESMSGWQSTGLSRIARDANNKATGFTEMEFKDMDQSSSTYNQSRWVPLSVTNLNLLSDLEDWVKTGQVRCVQANGYNNGQVEAEYQSTNPYSPAYQSKKWQYDGISETTCPLPPEACTGEGKKYINGKCEQGAYIYTSMTQETLPDNGGLRCIRTYHYQWSDGSSSQDYIMYVPGECPQDS
jgi:hypothetical protein